MTKCTWDLLVLKETNTFNKSDRLKVSQVDSLQIHSKILLHEMKLKISSYFELTGGGTNDSEDTRVEQRSK